MRDERSKELFVEAQRWIPGGVNSPVRAFRSVGGSPFYVARADKAELETADGDRLIDYVCTWGPAIHGHNHPKIRESIAAALERGTSYGTPHAGEVEMARRIVEMVPSVEKVRMCNSGTEATMSCIRLARGFTGRDKIIKFAGCYHGHVDALLVKAGSGALTLGNPDSAGIPLAVARETLVLPYNDIEALAAVFQERPEEIAALIVEPYPANCGLLLPDPGYLAEVRKLCSEYGAVLIFDEVMTGFRLARGGVQELENVTPDLTAMGKVIGGGLPVGAFGGKTAIMDFLAPLGPVYQAGTLSGNPLALAAGLAALDLLEATKPYERLDRAGRRIAEAVRAAAKKKGLPMQVPQVGSMFAIFFAESPVRTFVDVMASHASLFASLFHGCLERGVYLPPSAFETCFLSTAHTDEQLDRTCEVLIEVIEAM